MIIDDSVWVYFLSKKGINSLQSHEKNVTIISIKQPAKMI